MKKICISLAFLLFSSNAFAACDVNVASADFAQFTQTLATENPTLFAESQADFQRLAQEINQLVQSNNIELVCQKYNEFMANF